MKAVVWRGDRTLEIETVEDARLEAPTDVLMRITSTAISGLICTSTKGAWARSMAW
jgi:glutathione-independent formaldehyde dehydrogenase